MEFDWSQFWGMGVALTEFYLFNFYSLPVLRESCFKAPKITLDKGTTVLEGGCGACWILFILVGFIVGVTEKLF